jgi:hypothetical protein
VSAELNTLSVSSDRCSDQDPEVGAEGAGIVGATRRQARAGNDKRVRGADEVLRLGGGIEPLRGESRTWLWGEIDPQGSERSKPSRA